MTADDEERSRALDPHRDEERRAAMGEALARLEARGIAVDRASSDELADLLAAVERFEALVESRGGDLMVDDLRSSAPDDPSFVLPRRHAHEPLLTYIARIDAATAALRRHPRRSG